MLLCWCVSNQRWCVGVFRAGGLLASGIALHSADVVGEAHRSFCTGIPGGSFSALHLTNIASPETLH